jgi:hypothetical protein
MNGVAAIEGAVFLDFQAARRAPFIFGGGIVFVFALGALQLDDVPRHVCLPRRLSSPGYKGRALVAGGISVASLSDRSLGQPI